MATYGLSDVIAECMRDHARVNTLARGQTEDNKAAIYRESWSAMNAWVESRLCKRKGAELPMLGLFSWEIKHADDGQTYSRPIFVMSESFIKDHKVRRQRIHTIPNIVKAEEINYSKLAIKFSKNLTKNMIFNGTRDVLKKIGEFVEKNYEFEIEWSFGALKCKERKVRFEFNQGRLSSILPENLRIGTLPQQAIPDSAYEALDIDNASQYSARPESSSSNNAGSRLDIASGAAKSLAIPKLALTSAAGNTALQKMGATLPPITSEAQAAPHVVRASFSNTGLAGAGTDASEYFAKENANTVTVSAIANQSSENGLGLDYVPTADRPLSPRLLEIMQEMDAALHAPKVDKIEIRNKAKQRVDEQAYLRSLQALEAEAKTEERIALEADALIEDFEMLTRAKVQDFHTKTKTINGWLTEQMREHKKISDAELAEKKKFQGSFFLPENAGNVLMPSGSVPGGLHKAAIKEGLRKDLKYQIRNNEARRQLEKERQTMEEREYLDHVAMEMDLEAIEQRAKHLQSQKILLESWERDAHVRNLKKLQKGGINAVREYVAINLPEAHDVTTGKVRESKGFSVGYDTRRGKIND